MCDNKCDCQNQLGFAEGTVHNIGRIGCGQCNNSNQTEGRAQLRTGVFQGNSGWLTGIRGLQDTRNMSCSMIYASLAEKYRPTVLNAELAGASINRPGTPDAPQVFEIASSDQAYISPYNLEERAKKLNSPGGPEMPCICDPDCMCAPVCASDPTRNCLCEENGLFASVTQGIDIDDLDVPDLVRRNRHGSETSGSSVVSLLASIRTTPESSSNVTHHTAIEDDSDYRYVTYSEMKNQQLDRPHDLPAGIEAADTMSMSIDEMLASPDIEQFEFWDGQITRPPRVSSLSYRDALTQPFAKQCDYPPRRSSVAQRLFSSRNLATSNGVLGTGRKALKEANKRSLTDMSLTGLKFALRRASQMRDTVANN